MPVILESPDNLHTYRGTKNPEVGRCYPRNTGMTVCILIIIAMQIVGLIPGMFISVGAIMMSTVPIFMPIVGYVS